MCGERMGLKATRWKIWEVEERDLIGLEGGELGAGSLERLTLL